MSDSIRNPEMSDWLLREALRLADLGFLIFPCLPRAKKPYTPRGFHDATTDASQIERWWSRWPRANIGVSCEGLLVIDIDVVDDPSGGRRPNLWPTDPDRHEQLYVAAGAVTETPRRGRHLWFRTPPGKQWQPKAGVLAPGVDIRTTGSYVIVPPSQTEVGPYVWVPDAGLTSPPEQLPLPPDWLVEELDRVAAKPLARVRLNEEGAGAVDPNLMIAEGQRNSMLASLAGSLRSRGMLPDEIEATLLAVNRNRCRPALSEAEVRSIARSISRYPAGSAAAMERHSEGRSDWWSPRRSEGRSAWRSAWRSERLSVAAGKSVWRELPGHRPFPVESLPGAVQSLVVGCSEALGCHPAYVALPVLVVAGAAIGNSRRLQLKAGWNALPILWGAVVGESGTLKTAALQIVLRPVRLRQKHGLETYQEQWQEFESQSACYDKSLARWKEARSDTITPPPARPQPPVCERTIVADTTIEALGPILKDNPFGVLLARDELAAWMTSFDRYSGRGKSGGDAANWLSMFNAESLMIDRKSGSPRTIFIPAATVSVLGGIQPRILARTLGPEHRESGLAARLLLAYPPRQVKSWTETGCSAELIDAWGQIVERLYSLREGCLQEGQVVPRMVQLEASARERWVEFYNANAQELADLTDELAAAWSKFEEYAARLALVVHYLRWAAGEVPDESRLDGDSMAAGVQLVEWFKNETRRLYGELEEARPEDQQLRLLDLIDKQGGSITVREVRQQCRWLKSSGAAETALQALVDAGLARWETVGPTTFGGRPSQRLVLIETGRDPGPSEPVPPPSESETESKTETRTETEPPAKP